MLHLGGDYFIIASGIRKEWKGNNSLEEGLNHRMLYFPLHLNNLFYKSSKVFDCIPF